MQNMTSDDALKVRDLRFSWDTRTADILNIKNLDVPMGRSLFIHGPSGSGKSTLLNLLSGVLSVQHGTIQLLGQEFSSLRAAKRDKLRADHIGYIFQQFNLLPYLSVLDNVTLPTKISTQRRQGKTQHARALTEEAEHWLAQLQVPRSVFSQPVSRLSVGQQQRVAAARALIGSPEIIIADEPTSALDQQNIDNFMTVLTQQCRSIGSSLLFVSHDMQLAGFFDATYDLHPSTPGEQE